MQIADDPEGRVFIAGHTGMVGSAIARKLESCGNKSILTKNRADLDLCNGNEVRDFFSAYRIRQVYLCAAKVGGIQANKSYPAEFIHDNLTIQNNVIHEAYRAGVKKLLFLGSSCIYPRLAEQPIAEEALLSGALETTNEAYAIAKIAGIKMCESYNFQYGTDYRAVMPTNLYGPNDNFHPENSHVVPALLRRIHEARQNKQAEVLIWGSGKPMREFLHVDDMADACVFLMSLDPEQFKNCKTDQSAHINIGFGEDVSIRELADTIAEIVGYNGKISYDPGKPDGTPRKLLNVSKINSLGWKASIDLKQGLTETYHWFLDNQDRIRG